MIKTVVIGLIGATILLTSPLFCTVNPNFNESAFAKTLENELKTNIWPTPKAYVRGVLFDNGSPSTLYKWSKQKNIIFQTERSRRNPKLFDINLAQFSLDGLQVSTSPQYTNAPDVAQRQKDILDKFQNSIFEAIPTNQQMPMRSLLIDSTVGCFVPNDDFSPIVSLRREDSTVYITSQLPGNPDAGNTITIYEGRLLNNLKKIDQNLEAVFYYCLTITIDIFGSVSLNAIELVGWKSNKPKFRGTCRDSGQWQYIICDGVTPVFEIVTLTMDDLNKLQQPGKLGIAIVEDLPYAEAQTCPSNLWQKR